MGWMLALSGFVALFGLAMAGLVLLVQRGTGGRLIACLFAVAGLVAGWAIYHSDQTLRRETLFEVMAEGSAGLKEGEPAPLRRFEFLVEHPGVQHTLMVAPSAHKAASARGPAELDLVLRDAGGEEVVRERKSFGITSSSRSVRSDWTPAYYSFTPRTGGRFTLEVRVLTADVPHLHVRVADPENDDGERIPGF